MTRCRIMLRIYTTQKGSARRLLVWVDYTTTIQDGDPTGSVVRTTDGREDHVEETLDEIIALLDEAERARAEQATSATPNPENEV